MLSIADSICDFFSHALNFTTAGRPPGIFKELGHILSRVYTNTIMEEECGGRGVSSRWEGDKVGSLSNEGHG